MRLPVRAQVPAGPPRKHAAAETQYQQLDDWRTRFAYLRRLRDVVAADCAVRAVLMPYSRSEVLDFQSGDLPRLCRMMRPRTVP